MLEAAAGSRIPGRISVPSGRVPNLAPTPWPPHGAGRGRESRELPLLQGNRQSACVSTTISIIWEVVLRNGTFKGEPCSEAAVGLARHWQVLRYHLRGEQGAAPGRRIHQIPISSLRSGVGGEWVGARLRELDQDFGIQWSPSWT